MTKGGVLPMITSCSPGLDQVLRALLPRSSSPNLSSCKSPHEMEGAMIKSYYAERVGIDPKDIVVVSVMPCTAKKYEAKRPELSNNGLPDVDVVITTRELARMIKEANIDFVKLPDESFDDMLGESTGASVIFGATGGVMEAALRTAYTLITGDELEDVDFCAVRGVEGIKEATVKVGDLDVSVAVAHSTSMASKLLDAVKRGEKNYTFIEVMGCPGGCVNGGGQPIVDAARCAPRWISAPSAPRRSTARTRTRSTARATRTPRSRRSMRTSSTSPAATRRTSCCTRSTPLAPNTASKHIGGPTETSGRSHIFL